MYEHITFESILDRMLARVPESFDKREGSVIYDALAPAAVELQNMYLAIDSVLNETFADTQSREYLIRRCKERNIEPKPASYAIRQGEFNVDVPIGSRFSLNILNYVVLEKISEDTTGKRFYKLQCETLGNAGNVESGQLIPIEYIQGLTSATLTDVLIPGEDEEDTEKLRQRYFDSFDSQAFGGNIADYKEKVKGLHVMGIGGVGGVKVHRAWNGGGTVKLTIIDSEFKPATKELVTFVQENIDPPNRQGQGLGLAPIDHIVTVFGCGESYVDIQTKIEFYGNYTYKDIQTAAEEVIDNYFNELAQTWENSTENDPLVVRTSQIDARLLNITGVKDITSTSIRIDKNSSYTTGSISLPTDNIPIRGAIDVFY